MKVKKTEFISQEEYDEAIRLIDEKADPRRGVLLGLSLGFSSSLLWAFAVSSTSFIIGYFSLVVGFMVSQGFIKGGLSRYKKYGVIASLIAFFSIFLGNTIIVIIAFAKQSGITVDVALQNIDYIKLLMFMFKHTSITDVIFYLIAMRVAFSRSYIDVEKIGSVMQPSIVETLEESI